MTRPRISDIVWLAAVIFRVSAEKIAGPRGSRHTHRARFAVYHTALHYGYTTKQIGHVLGCRDHSTVVNGRQVCREMMQQDQAFCARVEKLIGRAAAISPTTERERVFPAHSQVLARMRAPTFSLPSPPKVAPATSNDDDLTDDELLSRAVAAHYARA